MTLMYLRQNPPRPVFLEKSDVPTIVQEVSIMDQLHHNTIMPLVAVIPPDGPEGLPILVSPFMELGSLNDVMSQEISGQYLDRWGPTKKSIVIFGTAVGMAYVHSKNILHRNLKPSNVFLNDDLEPVIGDFSYACVQEENMANMVGSALFLAPELISDEPNGNYTNSVDVYSYGVFVFTMFTGTAGIRLDAPTTKPVVDVPYLLEVVKSGTRFARVPGIPDGLWNLITACWAQKSEDRPSFVEIVNWFRSHNEEWVLPGTDPLVLSEYQERIVQGVEL